MFTLGDEEYGRRLRGLVPLKRGLALNNNYRGPRAYGISGSSNTAQRKTIYRLCSDFRPILKHRWLVFQQGLALIWAKIAFPT